MNDYIVPLTLQGSLQDRINSFCKKNRIKKSYYADARGKFIYLRRDVDSNMYESLGRLTYLGDSENMEFAISNFSTGRYDPKERGFPGVEYIDGTIEGALKAIITAYP